MQTLSDYLNGVECQWDMETSTLREATEVLRFLLAPDARLAEIIERCEKEWPHPRVRSTFGNVDERVDRIVKFNFEGTPLFGLRSDGRFWQFHFGHIDGPPVESFEHLKRLVRRDMLGSV